MYSGYKDTWNMTSFSLGEGCLFICLMVPSEEQKV
jgi:hypothetical protein